MFLASLLAWGLAGAACHPPGPLERARVSFHYDGDTLRLADGRRVRLLGIDTPEMNYHGGRPQPLAERARTRVEHLLPRGGTVQLARDRQPHDRFGRELAHAFRADGRSVEETLLREGLAVTFILPPNVALVDCLLAAERAARRARRGLWALPDYQVQSADKVSADGRWRRVRGRVTSAQRREDWVLLKLDRRLQLRVARRDWAAFAPADPGAWRGHEVIARGKLKSRHGRPQMRLWHPAQIEVSE